MALTINITSFYFVRIEIKKTLKYKQYYDKIQII